MHEPLTLSRALAILRVRWLSIFVTTVIVAGVTTAVLLTRPPAYDATAVLLTGQDRGIGEVGAVLELNQATQSLSSLVTERVVVEPAARDAGHDGDIDDLLERVSAHVPPNTQIIELTVRDENPKHAAQLANAIAARFSKLVESKTSDASSLSAIVWQEAREPKYRAGPRRTLVVAASILLGLLLGTGVAFVREHLDRRWRSQWDVEQELGVPVLGVIPDMDRRVSRKQVYR